MADPTDVTPQVATLEDSVPLTPDQDHVGLNAVTTPVDAGIIANGFMFEDTGQNIVIIRKTSASETTVVVDCPNACSQGFTTEHDNTSHMQAGNGTPTYKILGPFAPSRWATTITSANRVKVTFSGATTGLEIMVIRTPVVAQ